MTGLLEGAAVIVIDMQQESLPNGFYGVPNMAGVAAACARVIRGARQHGLPVIYTKHTYRPDGTDAAYCEPRIDGSATPIAYRGQAAEILPELAPAAGDIVIEKHRWSAFYGTDLDLLLRGLNVRQLIFTGVVTDGCLMTSVWDAYFRDWPITLVKDACGAGSVGSHASAVLTLANWVYGMKIFRSDQLVKCLDGEPYRCFEGAHPNQFPFTAANMLSLYDEL